MHLSSRRRQTRRLHSNLQWIAEAHHVPTVQEWTNRLHPQTEPTPPHRRHAAARGPEHSPDAGTDQAAPPLAPPPGDHLDLAVLDR
jgi:hypothetical protein